MLKKLQQTNRFFSWFLTDSSCSPPQDLESEETERGLGQADVVDTSQLGAQVILFSSQEAVIYRRQIFNRSKNVKIDRDSVLIYIILV